jgi:proteasome assembly chaperone (PAC2) family protein
MQIKECNMENFKRKITSRKLWAAIVGFASGIYLLTQSEITAGVALMISSVVGYLAAEGYVDGKAAQTVIEVIQDVAEQIDLEDEGDAE